MTDYGDGVLTWSDAQARVAKGLTSFDWDLDVVVRSRLHVCAAFVTLSLSLRVHRCAAHPSGLSPRPALRPSLSLSLRPPQACAPCIAVRAVRASCGCRAGAVRVPCGCRAALQLCGTPSRRRSHHRHILTTLYAPAPPLSFPSSPPTFAHDDQPTTTTTITQGLLKGFDQTTNLVLQEAHERVFSSDDGVKLEALGLTVLRGDNIAIIGELDRERDALVDLTAVRAEPLAPVVH